MARVDRRTVGIGTLALLAAIAIALAGAAVIGGDHADDTYESTYQFSVGIAADRSIENATFYVPVPTAPGEVDLGARFVQDAGYDRYEPAFEGYDHDPSAVDFSYEIVETDRGRMLAISADRIDVSRVHYREVQNETMGWQEWVPPEEYDPDDPSMGTQHDGVFSFTVRVVANDSIDTADPFGSEPLLPLESRTQVDCPVAPSPTKRCFQYDAHVYAAYEAPSNATVTVATTLNAQNTWFSMGWSGNEYLQRSSIELLGPGKGWYRTPGELEVGSGRYR